MAGRAWAGPAGRYRTGPQSLQTLPTLTSRNAGRKTPPEKELGVLRVFIRGLGWQRKKCQLSAAREVRSKSHTDSSCIRKDAGTSGFITIKVEDVTQCGHRTLSPSSQRLRPPQARSSRLGSTVTCHPVPATAPAASTAKGHDTMRGTQQKGKLSRGTCVSPGTTGRLGSEPAVS